MVTDANLVIDFFKDKSLQGCFFGNVSSEEQVYGAEHLVVGNSTHNDVIVLDISAGSALGYKVKPLLIIFGKEMCIRDSFFIIVVLLL